MSVAFRLDCYRGSNIPYRYGDDSLLEEVTSRMTTKKTPQGYVSETTGAPSDIDIMQSMISRISILEKHIQIQTKQITDKVNGNVCPFTFVQHVKFA